jgi:hypothetical protein
MRYLFRIFLLSGLLSGALVLPSPLEAQESPYIVTYDHYLEEPGNLEVEYFSTLGTQRGGNNFHAGWLELEYGATAWWTTELYLDGQTTFKDSTVFTGFRWENRFRLLQREHFINPVFYIEYEQISEADKIVKEAPCLSRHLPQHPFPQGSGFLQSRLDMIFVSRFVVQGRRLFAIRFEKNSGCRIGRPRE